MHTCTFGLRYHRLLLFDNFLLSLWFLFHPRLNLGLDPPWNDAKNNRELQNGQENFTRNFYPLLVGGGIKVPEDSASCFFTSLVCGVANEEPSRNCFKAS